MDLITDSDLDIYLNESMLKWKATYSDMGSLIDFIYVTGLRINEIYNTSRWSIFDAKTYKVVTEKGSALRYVPYVSMPNEQIWAIEESRLSFQFIRESNFRRYFHRFMTPTLCRADKQLYALHIFRYNRAKQMNLKGKTLEQIKTFFGEIDSGNMLGYINGAVYKK